MKRIQVAASFAALALSSGMAHAGWTPAQLNTLAGEFATGISTSFTVTPYTFEFMDASHCFTGTSNCAGANPDSPYAMLANIPTFGDATMMGDSDAQVLIMETPPPLVYFAITPYLMSRYYSTAVQANGWKAKTYGEVFESIGDSINTYEIKTNGSTLPGVNPNSALTVFVMTADANTYKAVAKEFASLGFPSSAINQIKMPVRGAGLRMLPTKDADSFMMMMRVAYPIYPSDQTALNSYIAANPFQFMQLTAPTGTKWASSGNPADKVPGAGTIESADLQASRDELINDLLIQYQAEGYTVTEITPPADIQTINYDCIPAGTLCNGDNPDALYMHDIQGWNLSPDSKDKMLVVGVDHVATGKATYISESIVDHQHDVGVAAAADAPGSAPPGIATQSTMLVGSALQMDGITDSSDPRYGDYSKLYALTIGYDCTGEIVCLTIPIYDGTNAGIVPGDTIDLTGRSYVDPVTLTRPSTSEIIDHRVFLLTLN